MDVMRISWKECRIGPLSSFRL